MVIELGPPVSEPSTGSQNFMPSTDSGHKFHKNWNPKLATHKIQSEVVLIKKPQP